MVKSKKEDARFLLVTQTGRRIGCMQRQVQCLKGLGLGRIGKSAVLKDDGCIRGMLRKVAHLVRVEDAHV